MGRNWWRGVLGQDSLDTLIAITMNGTKDKLELISFNAHNRADQKTLVMGGKDTITEGVNGAEDVYTAVGGEDIRTSYGFDEIGNKTWEGMNEFTSISELYEGLTTYGVNVEELSYNTYWAHNGNGDIVRSKEPNGSETVKEIDARGNVVSAFTGQTVSKLNFSIDFNQINSSLEGLSIDWALTEKEDDYSDVTSWKLYISTTNLNANEDTTIEELNDLNPLEIINLAGTSTSYTYQDAIPGETYYVHLVAVDEGNHKRSSFQNTVYHVPQPTTQSWSAVNSDDARLNFDFNAPVESVELTIGNQIYSFEKNGLTFTSEIIQDIAQLSGSYQLSWIIDSQVFSKTIRLETQTPLMQVSGDIEFTREQMESGYSYENGHILAPQDLLDFIDDFDPVYLGDDNYSREVDHLVEIEFDYNPYSKFGVEGAAEYESVYEASNVEGRYTQLGDTNQVVDRLTGYVIDLEQGYVLDPNSLVETTVNVDDIKANVENGDYTFSISPEYIPEGTSHIKFYIGDEQHVRPIESDIEEYEFTLEDIETPLDGKLVIKFAVFQGDVETIAVDENWSDIIVHNFDVTSTGYEVNNVVIEKPNDTQSVLINYASKLLEEKVTEGNYATLDLIQNYEDKPIDMYIGNYLSNESEFTVEGIAVYENNDEELAEDKGAKIGEDITFTVNLSAEEIALLGSGNLHLASRDNNDQSWEDIASSDDNVATITHFESLNSNKQYKLYFTSTQGKEVLINVLDYSVNLTEQEIETYTQKSFVVDEVLLNSSISDSNGNYSFETGFRSNEVIQLGSSHFNSSIAISGQSIIEIITGDGTGYFTNYDYDDSGNLIGTNENDGIWRTFKNDAYGNAIQTTQVGDASTTADDIVMYSQYDSKGNMTAQFNTAVTYGALFEGSSASTVQSIIRNEYDAVNNLVLEHYGNGSYREYEYNVFNVETSSTLRFDGGGENQGITDRILLDIHSREVVKLNGVGSGVEASTGESTTEGTGGEGVGTAKVYDASGTVTHEYLINSDQTLSANVYKHYDVDNFGRVTVQYSNAASSAEEDASTEQNISYAYNQADQQTSITKGTGSDAITTSFNLDSRGNQVGITYEEGVLRTQVFNKAGQVVHTKISRSEYNDVAAKNITTTTAYDILGNEISTTDEMGYTTATTYGEFGRILTQTNEIGAVKTFEYDDFGRVTREYTGSSNSPDTNITKAYDDLGRLIRVSDTIVIKSTEYTYDVDGNRATELVTASNLSQQLTYSHDERGNLVQLNIAGFGVSGDSTSDHHIVKWEYDDANKLQSVKTYATSLSNLVDQETYIYNNKGQLSAIYEKGDPAPIIEYTYYDNGQVKTSRDRTSDSEHTTTKTYYYRSNGLIQSASWSGWTASWDYDARGNLDKYEEKKGSSVEFRQESSYTSDNQKWQTTSFDRRGLSGDERDDTKTQTTTMTLDNKGRSTKNTITDGKDLNYYTNIRFNRLGNKTSETTNSSNMKHVKATDSSYTYDANGNLTKVEVDASGDTAATTKNFIYNTEGQILRRTISGGSVGGKEPKAGPGGAHGEYFYANGNQLGKKEFVINDDGDKEGAVTVELGTGSFRLVQTPGELNPTAGIGSYTAQGGETLQQVAANMLGNANLWFVIAQANGLDANSTLVAGQTIEIPQSIESVKIDSETHKQYSESEIVGSTTPGLDQVPPKPSKCQQVMAVVAVIAIVVVATALTGGAAALAAGAFGTSLLGVVATVAVSAIAGAVIAAGASILKQTATSLILTGKLPEGGEDFWEQVKEDAISGAYAGAAAGFGELAKAAETTKDIANLFKALKHSVKVYDQVRQNKNPETGEIDNWTPILGAVAAGAVDVIGSAAGASAETIEAINTAQSYITPWVQLAETAIRLEDDEELSSADWIEAIGGTFTAFLDHKVKDNPAGGEASFGQQLGGAFARTTAAGIFAGAASGADEDAAFDFFKNYAGNQFGTVLGNGINNLEIGGNSLNGVIDDRRAQNRGRYDAQLAANQYAKDNNLNKHEQTSIKNRIKDGQYDGKSGSSLGYAFNQDFNAEYLASEQANAEGKYASQQQIIANNQLENVNFNTNYDAERLKVIGSGNSSNSASNVIESSTEIPNVTAPSTVSATENTINPLDVIHTLKLHFDRDYNFEYYNDEEGYVDFDAAPDPSNIQPKTVQLEEISTWLKWASKPEFNLSEEQFNEAYSVLMTNAIGPIFEDLSDGYIDGAASDLADGFSQYKFKDSLGLFDKNLFGSGATVLNFNDREVPGNARERQEKRELIFESYLNLFANKAGELGLDMRAVNYEAHAYSISKILSENSTTDTWDGIGEDATTFYINESIRRDGEDFNMAQKAGTFGLSFGEKLIGVPAHQFMGTLKNDPLELLTVAKNSAVDLFMMDWDDIKSMGNSLWNDSTSTLEHLKNGEYAQAGYDAAEPGSLLLGGVGALSKIRMLSPSSIKGGYDYLNNIDITFDGSKLDGSTVYSNPLVIPFKLDNKNNVLNKDNLFKDADLEADYIKYQQRKIKDDKIPRTREDWLEVRNYWLNDSPMARGNAFNKKAVNEEWYPYNEIHLANGKRLDSYTPGEAIVSRKATNLGDISIKTYRTYLAEMNKKYAPGTIINSTKYQDKGLVKGVDKLEGQMYLELPDINLKLQNIDEYIKIASEYGIELKFAPEN
ncbi:hypothetical protein TYM08_P2842 [Marinicellulosiphila megalodicopiae]